MTYQKPIPAHGCGCDAPERLKSLISLDAALDLIARTVPVLSNDENLPLSEGCGRVLAEPVRARGPAPAFDNAAMDGYAVRCASLSGKGPWILPVSGRIPAGEASQQPLTGTQAVRIFTGAPVPIGADAVIAQEEVIREKGKVTIRSRPQVGRNIRSSGSDMQRGQTVLVSGARLGPREIATSAAAGAAEVRVKRPIRVSLLVTGNEVRHVGAEPAKAEIWDINTPMLTAALAGVDVALVHVERGADSFDALKRIVPGLAEDADLVITTGGISVGEEDHVKPVMQALGAEISFSGVAIKPGKPVSFGRLRNAFWLGLPGNPLAAFVTWHVFGSAILRAFLGQERPSSAHRLVALGQPVQRKPGRCEFRPARLAGFDAQGRAVVDFDDRISSGHVAGLAGADGLILFPKDADRLPQGALVKFQPFITG